MGILGCPNTWMSVSVYALVGLFRTPVCESYALIQILPSFLVRKKVNASKVILEDIRRNTRKKKRGNAREGEYILLHLLSSILKCH